MIQSVTSRTSGLAPRLLRPIRYVRSLKQPESVYFFTFHKCASSLFSRYALRHVKGLAHVDVDRAYYHEHGAPVLPFQPRGHVYGPMRLSTHKDSDLYRDATGPVTSPEFIKDRIAIVLLRDPRDVAVSAYYSFGYSHRLSPVEEVRIRQEKHREIIRSQEIDEVVVRSIRRFVEDYAHGASVLDNCPRSVLLKYEDMIDDWEKFARELTRYLSFSDEVLEEIYKQSRPPETEDIHAHRRSGKTGGFREKLQPETIAKLNELAGPTLERFGYAL